MAACTYDNPLTMMRECWQDGERVCAVAREVLEDGRNIPAPQTFDNITPWKSGQHIGDLSALHKPQS